MSRKIYILDKDLRTKLFMQYSLTFYENLQICKFPQPTDCHSAQNPINGSKKKKRMSQL